MLRMYKLTFFSAEELQEIQHKEHSALTQCVYLPDIYLFYLQATWQNFFSSVKAAENILFLPGDQTSQILATLTEQRMLFSLTIFGLFSNNSAKDTHDLRNEQSHARTHTHTHTHSCIYMCLSWEDYRSPSAS